MSPVLRVRGLSKTFADGRGRRRVLEEFDLDVDAGEVVALRGPSGSGKTTLMNLLTGLEPADAGSVRFVVAEGVLELHRLDAAASTRVRRAHMGYVFQFFNLVPTLTVEENVLLPLELNRRWDLRDPALARLEALGLGERLDALPDALSGGERQRVAIARALAHAPELVLADEPTGNLDAANADTVVDLLWRQSRELGCALLLATHDADVAGRADRVVEMGRARRAT
ncbi:MAG: ABC transporter ATP-binding protein [Pseudomonadota bacterium]